MRYAGKYKFFDFSSVRTYPIAQRRNKLTKEQLLWPEQVREEAPKVREDVRHVAEHVVQAREQGRHVFWMMGAHSLKLGHGPLMIDLIERDVITLLATQGAGTIHDFEMALIGETSEDVPRALPEGLFGMAHETGKYINEALVEANRTGLGYGEAIARLILGEGLSVKAPCAHPELSTIAAAYKKGIPVTVHATMGTDIIDQHPNFDGEAKGGCSGRDFGVFAAYTTELAGGVVLNIGSAVTMPEVLLKAVSMAANVGRPPTGMLTADFDLRPADPAKESDPSTPDYYFRDIKSVVVRIPRAFGGHGHYIQGNFLETIPQLWLAIDQLIS